MVTTLSSLDFPQIDKAMRRSTGLHIDIQHEEKKEKKRKAMREASQVNYKLN